MFLTVFLLFMPKSEFLKRDLSDSLPLLFTKKRPGAILSGRSWQKSDGSASLFFTSKSFICSQKTRESLEKPMSEFPTLESTVGFKRRN